MQKFYPLSKPILAAKQAYIAFVLILFFSLSTPLPAEYDEKKELEQLSRMSIEQLMDIDVMRSTITDIKAMNVPAATTIITREDIRMTPARTLLDLIEVYVPGATFVQHWVGSRFGMRGILGDQNHSFLLMVNSKNMNLKTQHGPFFELLNRDLADIEKIEVIHGPGSVTYGPGAIGGIINIITRKPDNTDSFEAGAEYNAQYRYTNNYVRGNYSDGDFRISLYGGISSSQGLEQTRHYYIDRAHGYGYGFMGSDWGNKGLGSPPPDMYGDYRDDPQVKMNLDIMYGDNWRLWARYNNFSYKNLQQKSQTKEGPAFAGHYGKAFTSQLENTLAITDAVKLSTNLYFSSKSSRDYRLYQGDNEAFDHISQRNWSFSENEIGLRSVINAKIGEDFELAAGGELYYNYWGPEWEMDEESFILGFQYPIRFAVLAENSEFREYYGEQFTTVIDDGINGWMFSLFGEANYKIDDRLTVLLSGRADKHEYSDWAISPRLALISPIDRKNTIKLIGQRSVRLPDFINLFSQDRISGSSAEPEILQGVELIYNRMQTENLFINASVYYNTIDQIAWLDSDRAGLIGEFRLLGVEAELQYSDDHDKYSLSYSYINQLDWKPEQEFSAYLSNIGPDSIDVYLNEFGQNRINNLPQNMIKAYAHIYPSENLFIHADGRFFWQFGQNDMLDMYYKAHREFGRPETRNEMTDIYDDLHDHGYGEPSFTMNLSVGWEIPAKDIRATVMIYSRNIITFNYVRYVMQFWENGNLWQYPRQVSFLDEPTTFGISLKLKI